MALAERAAEHGEILAEHEHQPAVDRARSGDDAVAGEMLLVHAEFGTIMLDEHVEFFETMLVEEDVQPLARGQPTLRMLRLYALQSAAQAGLGASLIEHLEGRGHRSPFLDGGRPLPCTLA